MIMAYCGTLGSGKTLMMSSLAYVSALSGTAVYANYALNFAWRFNTWDQLFGLSSGLICLDEAQVVADSREFKRDDIKRLTQWILQTRKLGLDFYFTTQSVGQVDTRIRHILDYMMVLVPSYSASGRGSRWELWDYQTGVKKSSGVFGHSPDLYSLYNTYELIYALT